jgi:four helix bundle protein
MEFYFDHEKLEVYRLAIQFVAWSEILLEDCQGKAASAKKHLDEASSSIPNNIAEGNGKWSKKDRKKFFEVARGSALECASCLDILVAKRRISVSFRQACKTFAREPGETGRRQASSDLIADMLPAE